MKHLLLTTILSLSAFFNATAQTEKGCKLLGASIATISNNSSESSTSYSNTPTIYSSKGSSFNISLNPNIGFFVMDNFAIGAGISIGMYKSTSKSSNTSSTTTTTSKYTSPSLGISPFARYYLSKSTTGKPFVEVAIMGNRYGGKSRSETSTGSWSETKTTPKFDRGAAFRLGYEHFLNNSIGIFASIGVQFTSTETDYSYTPSQGTGYTYTQTYKNFYTPINIGFQMHLVKPQKGKKK